MHEKYFRRKTFCEGSVLFVEHGHETYVCDISQRCYISCLLEHMTVFICAVISVINVGARSVWALSRSVFSRRMFTRELNHRLIRSQVIVTGKTVRDTVLLVSGIVHSSRLLLPS